MSKPKPRPLNGHAIEYAREIQFHDGTHVSVYTSTGGGISLEAGGRKMKHNRIGNKSILLTKDKAILLAYMLMAELDCESISDLESITNFDSIKGTTVFGEPIEEPADEPKVDGFKFVVGETYETQEGKLVKVIGRDRDCIQCSDNVYRYDRRNKPHDAGRVTGTNFDYSWPENFKR